MDEPNTTPQNTPDASPAAKINSALPGPKNDELAVMALVLFLIIILLGVLYLWAGSRSILRTPPITPPVPQVEEEGAETAQLENLRTDDSVPSLESDLAETELESLDAELTAIEEEIDRALAQ